MSFIRDLISRKRDGSKADTSQFDTTTAVDASHGTMLSGLEAVSSTSEPADSFASVPTLAELAAEQLQEEQAKAAEETAQTPDRAAMIWDIDEEEDTQPAPAPLAARPAPAPASAVAPAPAPAPTASSARGRRNKTRLIGFDTSGGDVVDLFDSTEKAATQTRAKFPVGWVLVVEGEGRGECFTLFPGLSQIGRDEDQAIQLDFGDSAISRSNHAAIVFDADNQKFLVGHGGKSNIVRHNDKPLISNEELKDGDTLRIGETTLLFKGLCGESFNWTATAEEGDEDVAIA